MMHIHYDPATGEIVGWETGNADPKGLNGTEVVALDLERPPDPLTFKIDLASLEIVEMSAEEKRSARLPKEFEVRSAIWQELCRTDHFMIYDRPISAERRERWTHYRQMLRDLSKLPSAAEMIEAWQLPPDAIDSINDLRERLKA